VKNTKKIGALVLACTLAVGAQITAQAEEFDPTQQGGISITLTTEKKTETEGTLALYQVAELELGTTAYTYVYTQDFASCGLQLEKLDSAELAQSLADYAKGEELTYVTQELDENGQVSFENLELGVYLVVQTKAEKGFSKADPFLVTIPMTEGDSYVYQVDATPKVTGVYETETEGSGRPEETPVPTETPAVEETPQPQETPSQETPSEETPSQETTPVVPSNPTTPQSPSTPSTTTTTKLPQTGQLNWPVPLMSMSGLLLFAFGWWLKQREKVRHGA
jgi:hypothetical protein